MNPHPASIRLGDVEDLEGRATPGPSIAQIDGKIDVPSDIGDPCRRNVLSKIVNVRDWESLDELLLVGQHHF
jgi:hypothetical protein